MKERKPKYLYDKDIKEIEKYLKLLNIPGGKFNPCEIFKVILKNQRSFFEYFEMQYLGHHRDMDAMKEYGKLVIEKLDKEQKEEWTREDGNNSQE